MNKPRRTKIALAVATGLIAVPVVTLVVLLNFDWNRAKPWLNARTSEMLGRPFAITGDLSLTWEKPAAAGPAEREEGWRGIIPWPYLVAQDCQTSLKRFQLSCRVIVFSRLFSLLKSIGIVAGF